jgi:hypothetical protein
MKKIGNLFVLAEKQLQKEGKEYTLSDIVEYAIRIRKWVSYNPKKIDGIIKLNLKIKNKKKYKIYNLKRKNEKIKNTHKIYS